MLTPKTTRHERNEVVQMARGPIIFGIWVTIITVGIGGLWSVTAPLNSASHALMANIVVDSSRKIIQHLEGGVVEQILVKDGDEVKAGDLLVKLKNTREEASLSIHQNELNSLLIVEARLEAESNNKDQLELPEKLLNDKEAEAQFKIQEEIFRTNRKNYEDNINLLHQSIAAHKNEIESHQSQLTSVLEQKKLIVDQLNSVKELVAKNIERKPRLLEMQARFADIEGKIGQVNAEIAKTNQNIHHREIEINKIKNEVFARIAAERKDTSSKIIRTAEEIRNISDILARTYIRSPQDGVVNNLGIHTIGGVVRQGEAIMEIVPQDDNLLVEAYVDPKDISQVDIGMEARIHVTAFKSRNTPDIIGKVIHVAPDVTSMEKMQGAYKIRIEIDKEQFKTNRKLKKLELYPGMMADVLIVNGTRTMMRYLLDPIIDSMRLAFKEK